MKAMNEDEVINLTSRLLELAREMDRLFVSYRSLPEDVAKSRLKDLRRRSRKLGDAAESTFAWDAAIGLAYEERTGQELQPGEAFTETDAARAMEILKLYPES